MALINKTNPFMFHQSVAFGPSYVSDELGLPVTRQRLTEPLWVTNRRKFLKKLSVSEQNRILTGDPAFRFDTVPYDGTFTHLDYFPTAAQAAPPLPLPVPPVLAPQPPFAQFNVYSPARGRHQRSHSPPAPVRPFEPVYRTPPRRDPIWPQPIPGNSPLASQQHFGPDRASPPSDFHSCSSGSSSDPPCNQPSPPPMAPRARPPGRPPRGPDIDGATALMSRFSTDERPGEHWLRTQPGSSSQPPAFQLRPPAFQLRPPTFQPRGSTTAPPSTQPASAFRSSSWRDRFSTLMDNVFPNPDLDEELPPVSEDVAPAPLPGYDRHGQPVPRGSPSRRGLRGRPR